MCAELIGVSGVGVAVWGLILTCKPNADRRMDGSTEEIAGEAGARESTAEASAVTDAAARERPAGTPATGSANCRNRLRV